MPMLSGGVRTCERCHKDGHTAFSCPSRPRKMIQTKKPLAAKTRIRNLGKMGKAYISLRKQYFEDHPGDEHYCYYCLYLDIEIMLTKRQAQVEHFLSKARHPELRLTKTNLVVSCAYHNKLKGSLDGPEFLQILDDMMEK